MSLFLAAPGHASIVCVDLLTGILLWTVLTVEQSYQVHKNNNSGTKLPSS